MKVLIYDNNYDYIAVNIACENSFKEFSFPYSDNYNSHKFYIVKRDKNRHYYMQEFVKFKPVTKITRLHKSYIESVLNIAIKIYHK